LVTNRFSDTNYDDFDKYEAFEEQFNPIRADRQARKKRRPKQVPLNIEMKEKLVEEVIDPEALLQDGFRMTYQPSKHESGWLRGSLQWFFDEKLISDVQAVVKGGKEASVYRCAAHESTGEDFLAAKVYRPRIFRSLSNDAMYKQGRAVLTADGETVHENQDRVMRALGKKSAFGQQVAHTSWLMYEYFSMQKLYDAGASVPKPYANGENAILMNYIGDEAMAAPLLSEVRLDRDEAQPLFDEVMRNIRLMLDLGFVHGDLSAYNILYWEGEITIIDFPQVSDVDNNSQAQFILKRDVTRICEYFERQGVRSDPRRIVGDLWDYYGAAQRQKLFDMSFDDEGNPL